jgi:hypothetical protein
MSIFIVTFLSCRQIFSIVNRLQNITSLSSEQKEEIVLELKRIVPTCPVIIRKNG